MGKFIDLMLSGSWEEYKRIQLYKKLGDNLTKEELKKKIEEIDSNDN